MAEHGFIVSAAHFEGMGLLTAEAEVDRQAICPRHDDFHEVVDAARLVDRELAIIYSQQIALDVLLEAGLLATPYGGVDVDFAVKADVRKSVWRLNDQRAVPQRAGPRPSSVADTEVPDRIVPWLGSKVRFMLPDRLPLSTAAVTFSAPLLPSMSPRSLP